MPFEEGRFIAAGIEEARLVPLESRNHLLIPGEPAWTQFLEELYAIAPVAEGLSNEAIADRLVLSARTVERHLSNVYAKWRLGGKAARAAAAARFSSSRTT